MKRLILTIVMALSFMGMGYAAMTDMEIQRYSYQKATFAGGCFWCMEQPFDEIDGVIETTVGYTGGFTQNPNYRDVSAGITGHAEAIEIIFDPKVVTYTELLNVFWRQINPTTPDQQFVDVGSQYRAEIFYHNDDQRRLAEASRFEFDESGIFDGPIVTKITKATKFYLAEDYHQEYYRKNPVRYKVYRWGSGRDQYLNRIWKNNELTQTKKN